MSPSYSARLAEHLLKPAREVDVPGWEAKVITGGTGGRILAEDVRPRLAMAPPLLWPVAYTGLAALGWY
jgi:hypothetical protein